MRTNQPDSARASAKKRAVPAKELVVRTREVVETVRSTPTPRREHAEVDRQARTDTHPRDTRLDVDRLRRP